MRQRFVRALITLALMGSAIAAGQVARAETGDPAPDCVQGWHALVPGTELYEEGLDLIRGEMGIDGAFAVDEMRYFLGPDAPWIIEPYFEVVRRWYVKASLVDDPSFRGRWIVEWRNDQRRGVAAVAPYDTQGFTSPDWRGFIGDGPPREVPGLPGIWPGLEYDFVTGEGDTGFPGLPDEVIGCLADGSAPPPSTTPPGPLPSTSQPPASTLPATGVTRAGKSLGAAAALMAIGGALLVATRRRSAA